MNKTIHMIWLDYPVPPWALAAREAWAKMNPDWTVRWHTDDSLLDPTYGPYWRRARWSSIRSDLLRFSIIAREGGVYVDTDTWPITPLDEWLPDIPAGAILAAQLPPGYVDSWLLAADPGAEAICAIRHMIHYVSCKRRLRPCIYAPRLLLSLRQQRPALIPSFPWQWFTTGSKDEDRRIFRRCVAGRPPDAGVANIIHHYAGNALVLKGVLPRRAPRPVN